MAIKAKEEAVPQGKNYEELYRTATIKAEMERKTVEHLKKEIAELEAKPKNIYQSIACVMADIGAVGKDSKNIQQNFMYRGIDAIMNAMNPVMSIHRMFAVPKITNHIREDRITAKGNALIYSILDIDYYFYAEDGSFVVATVIGEGMDSADKSSNKAMSVAFKYACSQVFCIPTEETADDPESADHGDLKPKESDAPYKGAEAKLAQAEQDKDTLITKEMISMIEAVIANKPDKMLEKLLATYQVFSLEDLTKEQYANAMERLGKVPNVVKEVKTDLGL